MPAVTRFATYDRRAMTPDATVDKVVPPARLAWFTPLAPVRSGISQYYSELLPQLATEHEIDVFVDGSPSAFVSPDARVHPFVAHDFMWKNRVRPYDLVIYQLGNAPCHDYMWAYLVR